MWQQLNLKNKVKEFVKEVKGSKVDENEEGLENLRIRILTSTIFWIQKSNFKSYFIYLK